MKDIKVIFLDVDGVLNYATCEARCCSFVGIASEKVNLLKQIVDATDAEIVLTSTWKRDYDEYINNGYKNKLGKYLREKLRDKGLYVLDTTTRYEGSCAHRGLGIYNWINDQYNNDLYNVINYVVLDDEVFDDFEEFNIIPSLVQSTFSGDKNTGGLTDSLVKQAIEKLNT